MPVQNYHRNSASFAFHYSDQEITIIFFSDGIAIYQLAKFAIHLILFTYKSLKGLFPAQPLKAYSSQLMD